MTNLLQQAINCDDADRAYQGGDGRRAAAAPETVGRVLDLNNGGRS